MEREQGARKEDKEIVKEYKEALSAYASPASCILTHERPQESCHADRMEEDLCPCGDPIEQYEIRFAQFCLHFGDRPCPGVKFLRSLLQKAQMLLHESIVLILGDDQLFAICQHDLSAGVFLHTAQIHQISLVDAGEL